MYFLKEFHRDLRNFWLFVNIPNVDRITILNRAFQHKCINLILWGIFSVRLANAYHLRKYFKLPTHLYIVHVHAEHQEKLFVGICWQKHAHSHMPWSYLMNLIISINSFRFEKSRFPIILRSKVHCMCDVYRIAYAPTIQPSTNCERVSHRKDPWKEAVPLINRKVS